MHVLQDLSYREIWPKDFIRLRYNFEFGRKVKDVFRSSLQSPDIIKTNRDSNDMEKKFYTRSILTQ